jgi:hypothetical protein
MRLVRTTLTAIALGVAVLTTAGPAVADETPKPVPAQSEPSAVPTEAAPVSRPVEVPEGAPETGGGPGGGVPLPLGGALLAAGAGLGVLVLRRRIQG